MEKFGSYKKSHLFEAAQIAQSYLPTTVKNKANFTGIRGKPDAEGKFYPSARWVQSRQGPTILLK
jgi:hypothetical protein